MKEDLTGYVVNQKTIGLWPINKKVISPIQLSFQLFLEYNFLIL